MRKHRQARALYLCTRPRHGANSAKGNQALLAGRKLLLADDSITIQKVVELSFADEGVASCELSAMVRGHRTDSQDLHRI